jgi:hypothetical protein
LVSRWRHYIGSSRIAEEFAAVDNHDLNTARRFSVAPMMDWSFL